MYTLIIRYVRREGDQYCCQVWRPDGKFAEEAIISAPEALQVEGRPTSNLSCDLRWYLEEFLEYPFAPRTEVAERVLASLKTWGEQAFGALFYSGRGRDFYHEAYRAGLEHLTLKIASDDPQVLAWPWEALRDPQTGGTLAHHCRIERQLSGQHDPLELPTTLPRDRINILLITARPYKADLGFRALSRPLLDLIRQDNLPVDVEMLRPPTFDQLRAHLQAHPGWYHIVHFDGHGGYGPGGPPDGFRLEGAQGRLLFETEDGGPDPVSADQLSALLREYRIPIMVLNACQSAMIDAAATDAFASVAAALQRAGVRSVVAMAYALYVSAARVFLPAFYRRLFEQGGITEAVRAGRQAMLRRQGRTCYRGEFPLQDWLVPVVYQQDSPDLPFTGPRAVSPAARECVALPPDVIQVDTPYGFIGRDSAVLELERAMRRPPAGILIHGLGGIGKTTLARGFVQWLADTGGLHAPPFWFTFNAIHSSEYVINEIVAALLGTAARAAEMSQKLADLARVLNDQPHLIVWDNFESVSGIPGTEVHPLLSEPDRQHLRDFLYALRGGKTKVIITSRSQETGWLDRLHCYRLPLGGLQGEERWTYCDAIVRDLGLTVDRHEPHLGALMDFLDGHPLAMRAMLTQLADHSAQELLERLRHSLQRAGTDEAQAKLFATLSFVEEALPEACKPLLIPLALHDRFVATKHLGAMARIVETPHSQTAIDQVLTNLEIAGLLHADGKGSYVLHPALTGFLRARTSPSDATEVAWQRAFVDVMGQLAAQIAHEPLHVQRPVFDLHNANFHMALMAAEKVGMDLHVDALAQALAVYAMNQRNFAQAERWYRKTLAISKKLGNEQNAANTYHCLGIIAQEQHDLGQAERWYHKAFAIYEKLGDERGTAFTYHQLGIIAQRQRDFAQAERWYRKALAIKEKLGNEQDAASTYHQLGRIAHDRCDFVQAERWYRKALAIKEKLGNEQDAAIVYDNLGRIAQDRRDFVQAEQWHHKALAIHKKLGAERDVGRTYHRLGRIAHDRCDFVQAEQWYHKALAISEKLGNEDSAADTYHELGMIAQDQRDFVQAEQWYRKSLAVSEKLGNEYGAASTYYQLGMNAEEQRDFAQAGQWLMQSMVICQRYDDRYHWQMAAQNFLRCYSQAPPAAQATLKALWEGAGLGPWPTENVRE